MRIALGSDEKTPLTDTVEAYLRTLGHEVMLAGPLRGEPLQWVAVAEAVARQVAAGEADQGVLFCWTGTGVSIAANKVPGVRAALCGDAETAAGARRWNDANVLCMSLRLTTEALAKEILDAWFQHSPDESERDNLRRLALLDAALAEATIRSAAST